MWLTTFFEGVGKNAAGIKDILTVPTGFAFLILVLGAYIAAKVISRKRNPKDSRWMIFYDLFGVAAFFALSGVALLLVYSQGSSKEPTIFIVSVIDDGRGDHGMKVDLLYRGQSHKIDVGKNWKGKISDPKAFISINLAQFMKRIDELKDFRTELLNNGVAGKATVSTEIQSQANGGLQ